MQFIIDNREKELKDYFKNNDNIKFENLDIGDIVIKDNDKIIMMIERKTLEDLSASIKDGRYKEQKIRLKSATCSALHRQLPSCLRSVQSRSIDDVE